MEPSAAPAAPPPELMASVPDALGIGVALCDAAGIIVHANPAYAALLGYRPAELAGRRFTDLLPPAQVDDAMAEHRAVIAGTAQAGGPTERPHLARDGTVLDLLTTGSRLCAADGAAYRLVSAVDVTDRRRRERALEAARARAEADFTHAPDSIFIVAVEAGGRFVYEAHNPASERATGIAAADLAGRTPEELWPAASAERMLAAYRDVVATGAPVRLVHTLDFGPAPRRWDTVLMPVFDAGGRITHIQGRARDVTDEQESRRRLKDTQDLLAAIHDVADVGISVADASCRLVTVNRAYANFVSDHPGRLVGRRVTDLVPAEVRADVTRWHRAVMRGRRVRGVTLRGVNAEGAPITYNMSSTLYRDGEQRRFSVTVLTDITRQKQLEADLCEREERLRLIADSMPALIGLAGSDRRLLFVNQAFCDWFRQPREALIGRDASRILAGTTFAERADSLDSAADGKDVTFDTVSAFPDGVTRTLRASFIARRTEGRPDGFYIFAFDVSAITRAQQALVTAKETAEAANRAKSQFLANMSHELRTPLNAIIGFSEMMVNGAFGPLGHRNYQDYAGDILDSGRHLLNLINGILDLSKIEAGRYELSEEVIDLSTAAAEAIAVLRVRAEAAGIDLGSAIPPRSAYLRADRRAIKQMLLNLLSNGLKFTPSGGRVEVGVRATAGGLAIEVVDTGIGIPPDKLPKITLPFVQVDNVLTRSHDGTGIGLHITKMLVELHDGRLAVTSAPGHGTTVSLLFPAARLQARPRLS